MLFRSSRRRPLVPLNLPYLAAMTPEGWDITLVNEYLEDINFQSNPKPDVVAITTWTLHSVRAYDISDEFRKQGIPVIMGGPHAWFHPDETSKHCDAVGVGEGEPIWAKMLEDAVNGNLQKIYQAPQMPSILPIAAPISRFKLTVRSFHSNSTMPAPTNAPTPASCGRDSRKGSIK